MLLSAIVSPSHPLLPECFVFFFFLFEIVTVLLSKLSELIKKKTILCAVD